MQTDPDGQLVDTSPSRTRVQPTLFRAREDSSKSDRLRISVYTPSSRQSVILWRMSIHASRKGQHMNCVIRHLAMAGKELHETEKMLCSLPCLPQRWNPSSTSELLSSPSQLMPATEGGGGIHVFKDRSTSWTLGRSPGLGFRQYSKMSQISSVNHVPSALVAVQDGDHQ